jgi:hypothetical protein
VEVVVRVVVVGLEKEEAACRQQMMTMHAK